MINKKLSKT